MAWQPMTKEQAERVFEETSKQMLQGGPKPAEVLFDHLHASMVLGGDPDPVRIRSVLEALTGHPLD